MPEIEIIPASIKFEVFMWLNVNSLGKKVEHILPKSVKIEWLRKLKRRTKYALQVFCQRYVETICKHWLDIVLER